MRMPHCRKRARRGASRVRGALRLRDRGGDSCRRRGNAAFKTPWSTSTGRFRFFEVLSLAKLNACAAFPYRLSPPRSCTPPVPILQLLIYLSSCDAARCLPPAVPPHICQPYHRGHRLHSRGYGVLQWSKDVSCASEVALGAGRPSSVMPRPDSLAANLFSWHARMQESDKR